VLVIALVVLAVFGLAALVVRASNVLLLAFGGILFAVLLNASAGWLARLPKAKFTIVVHLTNNK
jgi:hypothetical protein